MSSKPYEIVVAGGGAAGLGCALAAAAAGANVLLLEKSAELGGTVRQALLHTIGGLFDDQSEFLNPGLPVELTERLSRACSFTRKWRIGKTWVLNVDPNIYAAVITAWINQTPNISVCYGAEVTHLSVDAGRVKKIREIRITESNQQFTARPHALVDTTGNASVVRQVDGALVSDGQALGGFIIQLRGLTPDAMQFPKGVGILRLIRKAVEKAELPLECATVWLDTGVYADEAYAKFSVAPEAFDAVRMKLVADQLLAFLQALPGFTGAFIHRYERVGIRDGGRIKGEYCLTEQDIKAGKRFADAFVASVGSGGGLLGVGLALKERDPRIRIIGVEPDTYRALSAPQSIVPGLSGGIMVELRDSGIVDEVVTLDDATAIQMAHRLAQEEGMFCGISSGANVAAAVLAAERLGSGKRIVTCLCDSRDRYFFNEAFVT